MSRARQMVPPRLKTIDSGKSLSEADGNSMIVQTTVSEGSLQVNGSGRVALLRAFH